MINHNFEFHNYLNEKKNLFGERKDNVIMAFNEHYKYGEDFLLKLPSNEYFVIRNDVENCIFYNLKSGYICHEPKTFWTKLSTFLMYKKSIIIEESDNLMICFKNFKNDSFVNNSKLKSKDRGTFRKFLDFFKNNLSINTYSYVDYSKIEEGEYCKHYYPKDILNENYQKLNVYPIGIMNLEKISINRNNFIKSANNLASNLYNENYKILVKSILKLAITSLCLLSISYYYINHTYKDYQRKIKRMYIVCKLCRKFPTDVLCSKCNNVHFYCSKCLAKAYDLQLKFKNEEINLKENNNKEYLDKQIFMCQNYSYGIKNKINHFFKYLASYFVKQNSLDTSKCNNLIKVSFLIPN